MAGYLVAGVARSCFCDLNNLRDGFILALGFLMGGWLAVPTQERGDLTQQIVDGTGEAGNN